MGGQRSDVTCSRTFSTRRLGPSDVQPMEQLLAVFAKAFNEPETYSNAVPRATYLKRLLGKDRRTGRYCRRWARCI